jgi:hypothetical protein
VILASLGVAGTIFSTWNGGTGAGRPTPTGTPARRSVRAATRDDHLARRIATVLGKRCSDPLAGTEVPVQYGGRRPGCAGLCLQAAAQAEIGRQRATQILAARRWRGAAAGGRPEARVYFTSSGMGRATALTAGS